MSFALNGYQQISLFGSLGFLSERKQKILEKTIFRYYFWEH